MSSDTLESEEEIKQAKYVSRTQAAYGNHFMFKVQEKAKELS